MTNEINLDELDTRLAQSSAELLKSFLTIARLRAEDQETVLALDGLTACRLIVTAVRAEIQVELLADIDGTTRRIYAATFAEPVLQ